MGFGNTLGSAATGFATGGPIGAGIGLAASLIPNIVGLFTGGKQKREAKRAAEQGQQLFNQSVGYANQGLNNAQGIYNQSRLNYNGRMAGASGLEQNIYGNQANTLAAMGRNSTSAAQQLALAGAVQGNTNDAFGNLATMEAQDKGARFGQMAYAGQGVQNQYGNLSNIYQNQSNQAQNTAQQLGQDGRINQFNALQGFGNAAMTFLPGMIGNNYGNQPFAQRTQAAGMQQIPGFDKWSGMNQPINLTLPGLKINR